MTVRLNSTPSIINWSDSAKPFGEKLHQAVEYLKFRARNFNALAAYQTVEKFVAEQQKYLLFRQLFPDEWNRSQTSLFKAGTYENYTERTNEFLNSSMSISFRFSAVGIRNRKRILKISTFIRSM